MREFVIKALRNYGYRFLENQSGCYTFGKPLGYGILRADVREDEVSSHLCQKPESSRAWHF